MCVELGGSITGEHGVGVEKREYLPLMFSRDDIALMRGCAARSTRRSSPTAARCSRRPAGARADWRDDSRRRTRSARCRTRSARARGAPASAAHEAGAVGARRRRRAARRVGPARHRRLRPGGADAHRAAPARRCARSCGGARRPRAAPAVRSAARPRRARRSAASSRRARRAPARFRHGGVRDFIIGVRFVDGTGALVGGGGQGRQERRGFRPAEAHGRHRSGGSACSSSCRSRSSRRRRRDAGRAEVARGLAAALDAARRARPPVELEALDVEPPGRLLSASAARPAALEAARAERLGACSACRPSTLLGDDAEALGRGVGAAPGPPPTGPLVRVPTTCTPTRRSRRSTARCGRRGRAALLRREPHLGGAGRRRRARRPRRAAARRSARRRAAARPAAGRAARRAPAAACSATRVRAALDPDDRFLEPLRPEHAARDRRRCARAAGRARWPRRSAPACTAASACPAARRTSRWARRWTRRAGASSS